VALIFEVVYPSGEHAWARGYFGTTLVVDQVPPGPDSCLHDEIEVDFTAPHPHPVLRVVGGPRRPTLRVRFAGTPGERDTWMDARDADGWETLPGYDPDPDVIWVVAARDGKDPADLERAGGVIVRG
jgi:hypothetical protein